MMSQHTSCGFNWSRLKEAVALACLLVAAAGCGLQGRMGKKYSFTDKESVYISGTASDADAKALAESLKVYGYFDQETAKDVLLKLGPEGSTVSFVVQTGKWDDPAIVAEFGSSLAGSIAQAVGGVPFNIVLMDDQLNVKKTIKVDRLQLTHRHTEKEKVMYYEPVTPEQAVKLGKALQEAAYFDGTAPADVILEKTGEKLVVSFMVGEGKWDEEAVIQSFAAIGKKLAEPLGGQPVVQLINTAREVKKTVPVE